MDIKITDNSKKTIDDTHTAVRNALRNAGIFLSDEAADLLESDPRHVDTALLKNSITYALDGEGAAIHTYKADKGGKTGSYSGSTPSEPDGFDAVYIGTNVEYAQPVHDGTSKMTPNRFLRNALEINKDQLQKNLKRDIENG